MNKTIAYTFITTMASMHFAITDAHAQEKTMPMKHTSNAFNPAMSIILDGRFASFANDPNDYFIPGFPLGGEAGLGEAGFALGHSELVMSANVDDQLYGNLTVALHPDAGDTAVELEEAYIETTNLGRGFTIKAGRFFSGIGYMNEQHPHRYDFADTALPYRALMGNQIYDDGLQLRWIAPTDLYMEVGAEFLRGATYPAAGSAEEGKGAQAAFIRFGGDINPSNSWRLGLSAYKADAAGRSTAGHIHEDTVFAEATVFDGDVDLRIFDLIWKWSPDGNPSQTNFKLQAEYVQREENGSITLHNGTETAAYDGKQNGWYVQGVYQFMPRWKVGLRWDQLAADNSSDSDEALEEAGLHDEDHTPKRISTMLSYARSEYSLLRLQFNRDESAIEADSQWLLQYIVSLGAHGAHKF